MSEVSVKLKNFKNGQKHTVGSTDKNRACHFTKLIINKSICQALVDSGSSRTTISKKAFKRLQLNVDNVGHNTVKLSAANGGNVIVEGNITLNFEINNASFEYEFLVAEIEELDCILGNDFLEDFDVSIKFGKGIMQIGKNKIKLEQQSSNKVCRIKLTETITIPPDSEMCVRGYIDGKNSKTTCLVEPFKNLPNRGVLMCRSLVNPEQKDIPLSLINFTENKIKIKKGTSVASIQEADVENKVSLEDSNELGTDISENLQPLLKEASVAFKYNRNRTGEMFIA